MTASIELPRYQCHKQVWALKIGQLQHTGDDGQESDGSLLMIPVEEDYAPIRLDPDFVHKHNPKAGGYLVVYKDGYKSFSPAEAFESGYSKI